MNIDNKHRDANWKQIAAEFQSERDALRGDVYRMQQERDLAREEAAALRNIMEKTMTPAQIRELSCIARTGEPSDLAEFGDNALAFYSRDRVIGALLKRGLVVDEPGGFQVTDAGRTALAKLKA